MTTTHQTPREDRDHNAPLVAMLLGFDVVPTKGFAQLPAGFRSKWRFAEDQGFFDDCKTIGDMLAAYCGMITDTPEE